jgi:hypothetical protein
MRLLNKLKVQFTKTDESPSFLVILGRFLSSKGFRISLALIIVFLLVYCLNSVVKSNRLFSNVSFSTDVDVPMRLSNGQHMAEHIGPDFIPGLVRVNKIYSQGIHRVRLSFEQISSSSTTFIGIDSERSESSPYGWFIGDKAVMYQNPDEYQIFRIFRR